MANINVEYINPFIQSAQTVLKDLCNVDTKKGQPYITKSMSGDSLVAIIGITGDLKGQVIINMGIEVSCDIASKMMMGLAVEELNDMAKSAISELANMIIGNAATIFSKKAITLDITPPSICSGNNMCISVSDSVVVCIPLNYDDDKLIEINIAIKDK